ncbi:MAG: efflux RND transporter permease subunit [Gammaproteobacteria bacterium]|nr:efflux RND transporter permease subunit [Gammaproteobacteria bacterium]
MMLSDIAVRRPVFAIVLSLLLVAFGALSFLELPVREYPNITPPVISVDTSYPGASAEVVESRITQMLEAEISGIAGVKSVRSRSSDGRSDISVEFDVDRDIDDAANDVRDRISRAVDRLPADVDPPEISKRDSDARPVLFLSLSSDSMSPMDLTDYAERYISDRFAVINGVSRVGISGAGRPSMRIWLDRQAMAARNLTVSDIEGALRRENVELPAGRLDSSEREFPLRVDRNYRNEDDFRNLVLGTGADGHLIRLGEVGKVEVASRNLRSLYRANAQNTVGMGIVKESTANTVDVLTAVKAEIVRINETLPSGMRLITSTDDSVFIREAIGAVYRTIAITTFLVGMVILLFLGTIRATLIPVVTIPVCLTASFIVLAAFGYSVNLITLLALVLSIGLVVDDAIVVLENIHRRIEMGDPPLLAAVNGSRQVAFAVIATTLVLVAVFAPVLFLKDNIGLIFAELAVTISAAVIFSSFLALTLTPVMCSKILQPHDKETRAEKYLEKFFHRLSGGYMRLLEKVLRFRWVVVLVTAAVGFAAFSVFESLPQEYVPQEDQGTFIARIQAPEGTSYKHMAEMALQLEPPMKPLIEAGVIQRAVVRVPGWGSNSANSGLIYVTLSPWTERDVSTDEVREELEEAWREIPGLRVFTFMRSGISRGGGGQPVQFVLGGTSYQQLAEWRDIVVAAAEQNPGLVRVDSNLEDTQPQVLVRINKDRAASLGVSVQNIGRTMQAMMSEQRVTTYVVGGEEYDVILQAADDQRATPEDLQNIYVRSERSGELVPLGNLTELEVLAGPGSLNRYNRLRSVTISANLAPGYKLGAALEFLEGVVKQELPATAQIDYQGESLEYKESSGKIYFLFGMALIVVFLVMAAQFESFVHPLIIMMAVPLAMAGGFIGLSVAGKSFNIYSQIGIVMLIGIATKNGILIVEFINQVRDDGKEFAAAILEGARIRFRPVVMTAISTIMGSIPLMLATGAGSESRTTLGVVIFFGVSLATFLTLFVIPVFYSLLARGTTSPNTIAQKLEAMGAK